MRMVTPSDKDRRKGEIRVGLGHYLGIMHGSCSFWISLIFFHFIFLPKTIKVTTPHFLTECGTLVHSLLKLSIGHLESG